MPIEQAMELKKEAQQKLPLVAAEFNRELDHCGLTVLGFEDRNYAYEAPLLDGCVDTVVLRPDIVMKAGRAGENGDVKVVIPDVGRHTSRKTFRRRADGTFNWDKIVAALDAARQAVADVLRAEEQARQLWQAEKANRAAIEDLKGTGYHHHITATNSQGVYDFKTVLYGLSKAQVVGLAEHIKDWAGANGIQWP